MKIKLLNIVVFAQDYNQLVDWYKKALNMDVLLEESGEYHYTELGRGKHVIVGITPAKEMKHEPHSPRNNSTIMQLEVSDITGLFKSVSDSGGKVLFGPSMEEKYKFQYGAIADIEGNQIWVVETLKENG